LQDAARLLDQKKTDEAGTILLAALNMLTIIDQVIPLPVLLAREAINAAQTQAQKDKKLAQEMLETASHELERAIELGYTADDPDYLALNDEIKKLRQQLNSNEDTTSLFARVKEKLASLMRRRSENQTRTDKQEQPKKAA
jgi:uncharacterized membrane protein YukC